jgi:hypothetical protein
MPDLRQKSTTPPVQAELSDITATVGAATVTQEDSDQDYPEDYSELIARLSEQLRLTQSQLTLLQEDLAARDRPPLPPPIQPISKPSRYSLLAQLAFAALKYLFLFLTGFAIACITSYSLGATPLVELLFRLITLSLAPVTILTLCTIATAALLESLS